MIYVLTREERYVPGSQELLASALETAIVEHERKKRAEVDRKDKTYVYETHPVPVVGEENPDAPIFYTLTKESRMTPGTQELLMGSFDKKLMEDERDRRLKNDEEGIGVKLYYLYKVHKVEVL